MKASLVVALALPVLTLQAASPTGAAAPSEYSPADHPVLFVHGWHGSPAGWQPMVDRFRADGWPDSHLDAWGYDSRQSDVTTAVQLAAEVDRLRAATGADRVDVVTHSMGGLPARYYAKHLGGAAKIDAFASLAGPHHGIALAARCNEVSCTQMRPGSQFLTALNSGDETPGPARYATWRSPCDKVIMPESTGVLTGAVNSTTSCLQHTELLLDTGVYRATRNMITR